MNTPNAALPDPYDILRWPEGDWCFESELSPEPPRDDNYRVILFGSDEWLETLTKPGHAHHHINQL